MVSLVATNLEKTYGHRKVVKGISLRVSPGEIVGLLGPNGAGKTTTFYMIVGMVSADKGSVVHNGIDLTRQAMFRRARSGLGYLSQEPSIFRQLSVENNLRAILEHMPGAKAEKEKRIDALLEEFGLTRLRKQMAATLSGGEKRRCEIARALTTNPQILLLDEPFVGIDPITVADIQGMLQSLKNRGLGILISDHNVQATLEIVDRASIVFEGKILTEGPSEKLLSDPEARRVYLGEKFKI
ncbi:MAG: LPS export ABC transporter ATP-binding protein [Elusimicrobia bacterium]|nr:LPS export ABC transporter ATP-binding protein [Elusimicrobiota bacterium]